METRGIRNNNPLNLRKSANPWVGKKTNCGDPEFEQFVGMEFGFRAAAITLRTYMLRYRLNTIEAIVKRFAPANENNTTKYIADVCRMTGIGGREVMSWGSERVKAVLWAMAQIESGRGILAYKDAFESGWEKATKENDLNRKFTH